MLIGYGTKPVNRKLLVSSGPASLVSKYGLLFSVILVVPAAAIFYFEKEKHRK